MKRRTCNSCAVLGARWVGSKKWKTHYLVYRRGGLSFKGRRVTRSSKKRIRPPFLSNRRRRAVTGKHRYVVPERKQFLPDPAQQQIKISTRQVASANAAGKKDIAADEQLVFA